MNLIILNQYFIINFNIPKKTNFKFSMIYNPLIVLTLNSWAVNFLQMIWIPLNHIN